jgi:pantoate--beta-alanine ligase
LSVAENAFQKGNTDADQLRDIMTTTIRSEPIANLQYVSCADPDSLNELTGSVKRGLLSMAVVIGKTRLIDNILIGD